MTYLKLTSDFADLCLTLADLCLTLADLCLTLADLCFITVSGLVSAQYLAESQQGQGQAVFSMQNLMNIKIDPHEEINIRDISQSCISRPNFAWKLAKYYYAEHELKDHNCFGRKGKLPLEEQKLKLIHRHVLTYFPVELEHQAVQAWKECCVSIDKNIRNTFGEYSYKNKPNQRSTSVSNAG